LERANYNLTTDVLAENGSRPRVWFPDAGFVFSELRVFFELTERAFVAAVCVAV
jgi:hypothetical protein